MGVGMEIGMGVMGGGVGRVGGWGLRGGGGRGG